MILRTDFQFLRTTSFLTNHKKLFKKLKTKYIVFYCTIIMQIICMILWTNFHFFRATSFLSNHKLYKFLKKHPFHFLLVPI